MHLVTYARYYTGFTGFGTARVRFWGVWWWGNHFKNVNCCERLVSHETTSVGGGKSWSCMESMLMCAQHLHLFAAHHMLAACRTSDKVLLFWWPPSHQTNEYFGGWSSPRALTTEVQHFHHTQCCVLAPLTQTLYQYLNQAQL